MTRKKRDDEDLTRVLDGWKPTGRGDAPVDPTRVLDGWKPPVPGVGPAAEALQPHRRGTKPDPAQQRLPLDLDLQTPTQRAKWKPEDVTDVDAVWKPSEAVSRSAREAPDAGGWQPGAIQTSVRKVLPPRVLDAWKPGAWIGAVKSVFGAVARVVSTPQGPVVDTYPPHVLLALWPPQSMTAPFLDRWPQRLLLSAVQREDAGPELLRHLPEGAELWLAEHDIDWALAGEAVLLHEPGLREFQLKELRAFVEAERLATFERVNKAYKLSAAGQPIERV